MSSPSTLPSFTPTLAHSVNSSGRMGLYVDSSSCACSGCSAYRLHTLDIPLLDAADAGVFVAPPVVPSVGLSNDPPAPEPAHVSVPAVLPLRSLGGGFPVSLQRAPANHVWDTDHWVHQDSEAGRAITGPSSSTPAPSLAASAGGGSWASAIPTSLPPRTSTGLPPLSFMTPRAPSILAPPPPRPSEDDVMDQLRSLRSQLQIRQDRVYDGADRSHSDMQIADQEFDDLDRKIMAIEQCMQAFGAIFRTR